jgi:hypothetical protein
MRPQHEGPQIQVERREGYFVVENAVLDAPAASGVGLHEKMAWVVLCRCAKADGVITWSVPTMAAMASMSVRRLQDALKKLEEGGYVEVERGRKKRDGSPSPNLYRIGSLRRRLRRGGGARPAPGGACRAGGGAPRADVGLLVVGPLSLRSGDAALNGKTKLTAEEQEELARLQERQPGVPFEEQVAQAQREVARRV